VKWLRSCCTRKLRRGRVCSAGIQHFKNPFSFKNQFRIVQHYNDYAIEEHKKKYLPYKLFPQHQKLFYKVFNRDTEVTFMM